MKESQWRPKCHDCGKFVPFNLEGCGHVVAYEYVHSDYLPEDANMPFDAILCQTCNTEKSTIKKKEE